MTNESDDKAALAAVQGDLYEIAFVEAKDVIKSQRDKLDELRSRGAQFAALAVAATSLLISAGVKDADRSSTFFYVLASAGTALSVLMLGSLVALLLPRFQGPVSFNISAAHLVRDWIEADIPAQSTAQFQRSLILLLDDAAQSNSRTVERLQSVFALVVVCGGLSIVTWAGVVWAFS